MKYPGARGLIVRQTLASIRKTALVTLENEVMGRESKLRSGASRETRMVYNYPNGSAIDLAGLDDVSKVLSGEYDIVFIQQMEETARDDVQLLTTRLRNRKVPYQQLVFDCNPGAPSHWIKKMEADGWLRLINSSHKDNPVLWDAEVGEWTEFGAQYLGELERMPEGFVKDRMLRGLWVSPEGARFGFDPKEHTFRMRDKWPMGLPEGSLILLGKDWGVAAEFAALWMVIDANHDAWVFREAYEKGLTADEQAQTVVNMTARNEQVKAIYPDPTIFNRSGPENKAIADYYIAVYGRDDRFGPVLEGNRSPDRRKMGMATIDAMLGRGNGFPNLWIEVGCVNLIRELQEAFWWVPRHGIPKEDIDPTCKDHAITALYYPLNAWYGAPKEVKAQPTVEESRVSLHKEIHARVTREFAGQGRRRVRI